MSIDYVPNMVELRQPHRAAHLERLKDLAARGVLRFAGAWTDPLDGAIWVIDAESDDEVETIIRADPYFIAGLTPAWTMREVSPAPLRPAQNG